MTYNYFDLCLDTELGEPFDSDEMLKEHTCFSSLLRFFQKSSNCLLVWPVFFVHAVEFCSV